MQIYSDDRKRIGLVSGFKNRAIMTTLDSGDKELTFEYPANGKMEDLLKEEYYIRTKNDEFVLKAVEKGEQFNKYTAVLNVEELEGMAFPYGFESQEQTIRACLEFAFEETGWTVRTCEVTKKRTINEEGSVTAWDVLQKCLSTYRCECSIDSLHKAIDIYEQLGRDKGCYFIEGLNLRKLTPKSDTYEFYTRIYPIGKDGITPGWVLGHDYIDNFQYSSKVKAFVWKDERYTNTTSLIEDATAKLEEASRPYKAFTAQVADLAKAGEKYRDILSFGIGDVVTLVSKSTRTKEKQRIVKIVEYPETPEKNTVEISNARKTFAQIQQEATQSAKEEAISISNKTMKKVLENYSTTEEMETKITASKEAVEMGVMHTLEGYYDKTETDAQIKAAKGEIRLEVSQEYQTKEGMGDYSTTEETKALIDLAADNINIEVSNIKKDLESESAKISLNSQKIEQKVSKGDISAQISVEPGEVAIRGNRMTIEADNFNLTKSGEITATGKFITKDDSRGLKSVQQSAGMRILYQDSELGRMESGSAGGTRGIGLGTENVMVFHGGSKIGYIYNPSGLVTSYQERHVFAGDVLFLGSIACRGSKNRAVDTNHYGTVAMNAVESAAALFMDAGSGRIGSDGYCYIFTDEKFRETIEEQHKYYFFITSAGNNACVVEKERDYVKVKGEPNEEFDWMILAKQKGYGMERMEKIAIPNDAMLENEDTIPIENITSDYLVRQAFEYLRNYEREIEG